MKLRNANSSAHRLPSGQVLAPGEIGEAPDSMREGALVKAGVFVVVEEFVTLDGQVARVSPPSKPFRSGRGGR